MEGSQAITIATIVANLVIAAGSFGAWLWVLLSGDTDNERLAQKGLGSLKYFTVLSNLFSGTVSTVYVVCLLAGAIPASWLLVLKLMAASAVALTLLTVVLFLAPRKGWHNMFAGGNFWMHLILPVLAVLDCCLLVPVGTLPFGATFLGAAPLVVYGTWYAARVLIHGPKVGDTVYDFYGFFAWGLRALPLVASTMLLAAWLPAVLMWLASGLEWMA